jgi:hypothetical protein
MQMTRALALALAFFAAASACAADTAARKYPLAQRGSLQMSVPATWADEVRTPPGGVPPTIMFRPRSAAPFEILVTPIWPARPDIPEATPEAMRSSVQRAIDEAKPDSVEQDIPIRELTGASGPGFYFSATDKAPKPGEYKYLTQSIVKVNDLTVTFTILTNDGQEQVAKDALDMVRSAAHLQP